MQRVPLISDEATGGGGGLCVVSNPHSLLGIGYS